MEFLITTDELTCICLDGGIFTSKGMRKICLAVIPSRSDVRFPFMTVFSYSTGKPSLILIIISSAATTVSDSLRAFRGVQKIKTNPTRIIAKACFTGHLLPNIKP
jgi:hypothetical protein